MAYQANDDLKASIDPLTIYARYAPSVDAGVYRRLGDAYAQTGQDEQGREAYDQALALSAHDIPSWSGARNYPSARLIGTGAEGLRGRAQITADFLRNRRGAVRVYLEQEAYGKAYTQLNKSEQYAADGLKS
jgi:tetratricopeptide (TPR) repeat protein